MSDKLRRKIILFLTTIYVKKLQVAVYLELRNDSCTDRQYFFISAYTRVRLYKF